MTSATPKLFGSNRSYERWRWQIFAITWLAYAGFYLTRKSFALAKTAEGFGLTNREESWVDGGFLTAYALGMFVAGICGDRFGTRKVIVIGMIGCVLSAIGMGLCDRAVTMTLFSVLHGLFQSTGWAPLSKNVTNFFSRRERGVVMGFWCTNYAAGGAIANIYGGWIGDSLGWRAGFYIPALTLLGVLGLFTLAQRNRPEDVGLPPIEIYHQDSDTEDAPSAAAASTTDAADEKSSSWKTAMDVLSNPMVLLLALTYFCLKPARYAILNWGPKYVSETVGSNMADSGTISAMFDLAGPVSVILAGYASDRLFGSRRMPVSVICLFLLGGLLLVLDRLPHTRLMLGAGLFLLGILTFAPDSLVSGTAAVDFGTKRGASTASGLINGAGSIGGIVGGTLPGVFRDQWGWQGVFNFLAAAVIVAALLLLPKWNALPRQKH